VTIGNGWVWITTLTRDRVASSIGPQQVGA
jgi:hypothetical protein